MHCLPPVWKREWQQVTRFCSSSFFKVLLCSGSFFGPGGEIDASWDDYVSGKLKVPIDTYVLGPKTPEQLPKYCELIQQQKTRCFGTRLCGQKTLTPTPMSRPTHG